jgi:hypothetical protein
MPMQSLLASSAFAPEDVKLICEAFDSAWLILQKSGADYADGSEVMTRERLAKRIIETARAGVLDRIKLVDDAVEYALRDAGVRQQFRWMSGLRRRRRK